MLDLLLLFLPFFALVLMGWAAARKALLPVEGIPALNTFMLYFALPSMVFRLAASGALQQPDLTGLLLAYALGGTVVVGLSWAWARRVGRGRRDAGLVALVSTYPNTGFLGLPLLSGLLGTHATGPLAATMLVDILWFCSLCLGLANAQGVQHALKGAVRNPLMWALALGLAVSLGHWTLPVPVVDTVRLLAQAASPVALFTLGAILARAQIRASAPSVEVDAQGRVHPRPKGPAVHWPMLLKLAVHPMLVGGLGWGLQALGWPLSEAGLTTLVLAAALPSASSVSMLSEREGADTGLVARIILWTTAGALFTMVVWATVLGVRPGH